MMEAIYKLFNGAHIDLDKIISISDVIGGKPFFHIYIDFMLKETPLDIMVQSLSEDEFFVCYGREHITGNIFKEHEILLNAWKEYKIKNNKNNVQL